MTKIINHPDEHAELTYLIEGQSSLEDTTIPFTAEKLIEVMEQNYNLSLRNDSLIESNQGLTAKTNGLNFKNELLENINTSLKSTNDSLTTLTTQPISPSTEIYSPASGIGTGILVAPLIYTNKYLKSLT